MSEETRRGKLSARSRAKVVLAVVLAVMCLLLIVMGVFFVRVLQPARDMTSETPTTDGLTWVRSLYGFGPAQDEQLLKPTEVAIAPDGTIYASDPQRDRIMAFRPDGTFLRLIHTGAGGTGPGMMQRPTGLSVDSQGDLYVSDMMNQKVLVFDASGHFLREWPVKDVLGVHVRGDKVLVYADGKLVTYSTTGQKIAEFGQPGRGFGAATAAGTGITFDDKAVYVADANNASIKAYDTQGHLLWSAHSAASTPSSSNTTQSSGEADLIQLPTSLTFDGAGRLIVLDPFSFKLLVLDPKNGKVLKNYGDYGTTEGLFYYASGVAYDPARDWFAIADTNNNRVQIVRIPGSGGGAVQSLNRALTSPLKICAVPLVVLLIALAILATTRPSRSRRSIPTT